MKKIMATALLIVCYELAGFSQVNQELDSTSMHANDSLKTILSSKTFTLEEEYIGDWGSYMHVFVFTLKRNSVSVQWENPELLKNGKELDIVLPLKELNNIENIFIDCSAKIKASKKGSTEHILYKFKNKNLTYVIDDKFTMECNDNFKTWKEKLFQEGKKQEKR